MATARGNYSKGLARREDIVDAALELFIKHGYDRTSVREIARLSGLSQAGLLHHFRNKEELFIEVLRRRDVRNEHNFSGDSVGAVTVEGLTHIIEHNAAEPGLVGLYVTMSAESTALTSESRQFFIDRYAALRRSVSDDIRRQQEAGQIARNLDPEAVATLLLAAADGLQIQWLLSPEVVDMGAKMAVLTSLFASDESL